MGKDINSEFDLIEKFNDEAPMLPDSLKKEKVIEMLEKNKPETKKKKRIFPKILASAAALLIVFSSVFIYLFALPEKGLVEANMSAGESSVNASYTVIDNGFKASKLMQAESKQDLKNHFLRMYRLNKLDDMIDNLNFFAAKSADNMAAVDSETIPMTTQTITAAGYQAPASESYDMADVEESKDSFGQTNTQVENVNEADIIKNDGKYIYILSGGSFNAEERVTILDAQNMKVASKIELNDSGYYYNIQEMYVDGDRLIILAKRFSEEEKKEVDADIEIYYGRSYDSGEVVSLLYDISDRENPKLVRTVTQDGNRYISSRMIDGVLYNISLYRVRAKSEKEINEKAVPSVNGQEMNCDCVYIYDYDSDSYVILTAYDTRKADSIVTSLSILGMGEEVYCSRDALYVAGTNYSYDENYTEIYSFKLNGTDISYRASGTVKGTFLNQFSFDEYEENLRVATTYYSYKHDIDVSSVYVLNKNLQLIGALEDIANDEQVKSVRFMGEVGYIVTFRNTDPLFTLDLSNPTAPKVVGEVKLPGFSSYLHPISESLLVGLGYDGDEENIVSGSLKVSLFDVSDLKNPKEVDSFILKDVQSDALYDHKAFITYPQANLIGFPVVHYDNNHDVLSYKLLKIENGEISNHLGYVHQTDKYYPNIFRGTYIGQKLYTVTNYSVCEFDINTAELLRSCEIMSAEEDKHDELEEYTQKDLDQYAETTVALTNAMTSSVYEPTEDSTVLFEITTQVAELYFSARITEVRENSTVLIEVTDKGNSLLSVGTQAYISVTDSFEKDDEVKIVFDGTVYETYPCRIPTVYSIEKLNS